MYQSNWQTTLSLTLILEVNKMMSICGRIDEAITNRFVNIRFPSYFTNNPDELANNPNAQKGNIYFKSESGADTDRFGGGAK